METRRNMVRKVPSSVAPTVVIVGANLDVWLLVGESLQGLLSFKTDQPL
jgi:hypothetical protein